jgi:hypothetical protein
VGALGQVGAQVAAGSIIMKYSRTDEAQADAVGAIIMYKAGYNPQAMADFFQKLEKAAGNGPPQFLSDHPNPGNRYAAITKEIQDWPAKSWLGDTPDFPQAKADAGKVRAYTAQEIQQRARAGGGWDNQRPEPDSATAGTYPEGRRGARRGGTQTDNGAQVENAAQTQGGPAASSGSRTASGGTAAGAVAATPSSSVHTLRQRGYSMEYPNNWQPVSGSQTATTIAPDGGVSKNAIAYGVMVDEFAPSNPNASLSQQTQELIRAIREQNPEVRAAGSIQRITVNGAQGQSVELLGRSPVEGANGSPLPERDWLVTIARPNGSLLYLVFIAPDRDFAKLRPTFEQMLRSVRMQ